MPSSSHKIQTVKEFQSAGVMIFFFAFISPLPFFALFSDENPNTRLLFFIGFIFISCLLIFLYFMPLLREIEISENAMTLHYYRSERIYPFNQYAFNLNYCNNNKVRIGVQGPQGIEQYLADICHPDFLQLKKLLDGKGKPWQYDTVPKEFKAQKGMLAGTLCMFGFFGIIVAIFAVASIYLNLPLLLTIFILVCLAVTICSFLADFFPFVTRIVFDENTLAIYTFGNPHPQKYPLEQCQLKTYLSKGSKGGLSWHTKINTDKTKYNLFFKPEDVEAIDKILAVHQNKNLPSHN